MDDLEGSTLWLLTTHLAMLSFAAVGGGVIMLAPDIHRYVVDVHHWISSEQFAAAYAIAQAAPGPNMLFVTLVGWQTAGWPGAVCATCAVIVPPAVLTFMTTRLTTRASSRRAGAVGPFGRAVRNGLAPLSVGLLGAGAWVLFATGDNGWRNGIAVVVTLAFVLRSKINPLWLIVVGALAGIFGLIG